jgi:hypothetical protein
MLLLAALAILAAGCVQVTDDDFDGGDTMMLEPTVERPTSIFDARDDCPAGTADADGDGICSGVTMDCDDTDPAINPGAMERCDGVDNDCDSKVDEGCDIQCYDECTPEGQYCAAGTDMLKKCMNTDNDPCLELLEITCTYGCESGSCRDESGGPLGDKYVFTRSSDRPSQSESLDTSRYTISTAPCPGAFLGAAEWNEQGSLCRRGRFEDAGRGYLTPLSCCERFYGQVTCVRDMGEVPYQAAQITFKYHEVGCYGEADPSRS